MTMERCLRCEGPLEKGFMIEKGHMDVTAQSTWTSGEPNTSFWRMSALPPGSKPVPVVTYRCRTCGRLESFAHAGTG